MTLSFDSKDEMRLRMADLERKLAESEDERCKLEKTCSILMRAFREEEKARYKTLNKNYEKFLQDCTVRKRRNDIILKSLCRIEDRSRALFAKTERLKLLKDRYISYLKITDIKDVLSSQTWTTLPASSPAQKTTDEVIPKLVQWKNPPTRNDIENIEEKQSWNYKTPDTSRNLDTIHVKYNQNHEIAQNRVVNRLDTPLRNDPVEKFNRIINQEKSVSDGVLENNKSNELEVKDSMEMTVSRRRNNLSHEESIEKLKKALSFEEEHTDNENVDERHDPYDKNDAEENEEKENNVSVPRNNQYLMTSSSDMCEDHQGSESPEENLPKGLDGVDYQNETYPESYYEQPVHHHNHSSIIGDVILEEDETEQEIDDEEKNNGLDDEEIFEGNDVEEKAVEEGKSNESNSEKLPDENSDRKKNVRSNLIHLLESDSESFQIEHGDAVSGNDDSDFDFSFH